MSQNAIKFIRFLGYKKYSENNTDPEVTVTMVLPSYYSSSLNIYCK